MTKSDLIDRLTEKLQLPKGRAEQIVEVVFGSMEEALCGGRGIEIRGFGSFEVREYEPYEGRNPRTGDTVQVKAKRLPFFKVGKELKERINAARGAEGSSPSVHGDGATVVEPAAELDSKPPKTTLGG